MNIFDKVRIKRKIHKMFGLMRKQMNEQDIVESVLNIKGVLQELPERQKEGVLDEVLKVLKNGI